MVRGSRFIHRDSHHLGVELCECLCCAGRGMDEEEEELILGDTVKAQEGKKRRRERERKNVATPWMGGGTDTRRYCE